MVSNKVVKLSKLKSDYLSYFSDLPIQKYAAMSIGKDEDTIIRWKKEDTDFADATKKAKADWVRKKALQVKAEFALERLEAEIFGRRSSDIDLTVNMPTPVIYIPKELPYNAVHVSNADVSA